MTGRLRYRNTKENIPCRRTGEENLKPNELRSDKKAHPIPATKGMDRDDLIKALSRKNPGIRGRAALAPEDIGERAIKSLVRAFKKTEQRVGWLTGQQNEKSGRSEVN